MLAALALSSTLGGCAGRRAADEAPRRRSSASSGADATPVPRRSGTPTPVPTSTPVPTPTPTPVPLALACASAADCTLTPYGHLVQSEAACYCPTCPVSRNAAIAAANEDSWKRICGEGWATRARCQAPMCPRSSAPGCAAGACEAPLGGHAAGGPPG